MLCWLLPVRDGAATLEQTLHSIRSQTVRPGTVLAWDNGSQDQSIEILKRWIPGVLPGRVVSDRPFDDLGECLRRMVE
ncbi:MAG: glycosyl transferase family 2, partial [Acidobacteria bacterium]